MPPIRTNAPRAPVSTGSTDAPAQPQTSTPAAPGSNVSGPWIRTTASTAAPPKNMFELRPAPQELTRADGQPNTTWHEMTQSLGRAFDMRAAGRSVDTNLLHELSRHEVDGMPQRVATAELAAMGAIDSKAMEQISTNTNFGGWKLPLEDRVAFALVMNTGDKAIERFPMNSGKPTFDDVAQLLGKPAGGAWLGEARTQAKELLDASRTGTLLDSPVYAKLLAAKLPDGGAALGALKSSPRAVIAFSAATEGGASAAQAKALAQQAADGKLDVVTFRALAPKPGKETVTFAEEFPNYAIAPKMTLDEAASVATSVANKELGFGQLHGFMMTFGKADDWPRVNFSVPTAVEVIKAVNRGEVDQPSVGQALQGQMYFANIANPIWDHFFSGKSENGGNKYTVSGIAPPSTYIAPFMQKLDAKLIIALAKDGAKRMEFADAFRDKVRDGLPSGGIARLWDRMNGQETDEVNKYNKLVDDALAHARARTGL